MSLLTNLTAYYKMNEASGNALDAVGSNDLTDTNSVGSTTGKVGNARSFVVANSTFFNRASNSTMQTGDIDFTIALWVNLASKSAQRNIMGRWASGGNFEYLLYYDLGSNTFTFVINVNGSDFFGNVGSNNFGSPTVGDWNHVVVWHDSVNNELGISVNANTPNTQGWSFGVFAGSADTRIGETMDGSIDEVGFWKRVLTSQERTDLYNSGAGLTYPFSSGGPFPFFSLRSMAGGMIYQRGGIL
jgi:hypothetical protein